MGRGHGQNAHDVAAIVRSAAVETTDDDRYLALCEEHADWLMWADTHDYDPSVDYHVVFEHRDHPLLAAAQRAADRICADAVERGDERVPFDRARVFPVRLPAERHAVAVYVYGTSSEPVVLVDIAAHEQLDPADRVTAITDSVVHELRHAVQDSLGVELSEDDAERGSGSLPF